MRELEEKERELEASLAERQAELDKLGDLERQLLEKEARRERMDNMQAREAAGKVDAQAIVAKMREEYAKGLEALGNTMEEERQRQFDQIEARLEQRKALVEQARIAKEEERKKKEAEAKLEKEQEIQRIKDLRAKKAQLEKTLAEGQRLIYKQCYSRPLYSFNRKLHDL